jgi:hypothetical protein
MRRCLLYACLILSASATAEDKPAEALKPLEFIGRVEKIVYLSEYKGEAVRMDHDPRFVLIVSVQRATDKSGSLPKEKEFAFAIHSKTGRNAFVRGFTEGDLCTFIRDKKWRVEAVKEQKQPAPSK